MSDPIGPALSRCAEALRFAGGLSGDRASDGWRSIALIMALQGALITALQGYESAEPGDILDQQKRDKDRLAPVGELLRRARSDTYLNPPERLEISPSDLKRLKAIAARRNAALHFLPLADAQYGPLTARDVQAALAVLRQTLFTAPAFDPAPHALELTFIGDHMAALSAAFPEGD